MFHLLSTAAGVVLLALTLWQIFADLFHPTAQGALSDWIARGLWRLGKHNELLLSAAGPLAFILVVLSWISLVVLGFALIYWPAFPGAFRFTGPPEHGFLSAAYFSMEVLTTLGLGEITPVPNWLRFTVTAESMIGLGVVTACVSWTVLLYPALSRMRVLARETIILADAAESTRMPAVGDTSEYLLTHLTEKVVQTRVDLIYFPIIYYFHAAHRQSSLAQALPIIARICDEASAADRPERLRFAAKMLDRSLDDLASVLGKRFLAKHRTSTDAVIQAFAEDQQIETDGRGQALTRNTS
ncbi:MAG: two pore domain potassium channel family protein [Acidobacteriaceae bacterium]|nr:two pore domain potassium channel family protein [Acidobacteriaceae bacterium]